MTLFNALGSEGNENFSKSLLYSLTFPFYFLVIILIIYFDPEFRASQSLFLDFLTKIGSRTSSTLSHFNEVVFFINFPDDSVINQSLICLCQIYTTDHHALELFYPSLAYNAVIYSVVSSYYLLF